MISNDACKTSPSWSAMCRMALLSLVCLTALGEASIAQTEQPAAASSKVQELIQLLDHPEVRAALEAAQPTAADPELPAAAQIAAWENGIREHLTDVIGAFPSIPGEAANAAQIVQTQINNHGFSTVLILFAGLLALGFGAEWLFRVTVLGTGRDSEMPPAGAAAERHPNLAASLLTELAPVVVFALVSAGVFLAFSWPPLLRLAVMTYLVAFIAVRLFVAVGRILRASHADAGQADAAEPTRVEAHFWYRRLVIFAGYFMAVWATLSLLPALGFSPDVRTLLSYLAGMGLVLLAIEIVWRRPGVQTTHGSRARNWLISIYLVALWGVWVAGLTGILWLGIYALLLPRLLAVIGNAAASVAEHQDASGSANSFRTVMLVRGARVGDPARRVVAGLYLAAEP